MLRTRAGAVNDIDILSHNNLNFRGIPFTIGLYVEQPPDCARAYGYRDQWVFPVNLPLADSLKGWWHPRNKCKFDKLPYLGIGAYGYQE